jgi:small subunit ribosomal protein S8
MSMTDPIGDLLTRIRNGQHAKKSMISAPASKMRENVLKVLEREGYIRGFSREDYERGHSELTISLKYYEGEPVIQHIQRVSKPGRRVYASVKNLPRVSNGLGISILSTSHGIMSDLEARDANVGGEILCQVF